MNGNQLQHSTVRTLWLLGSIVWFAIIAYQAWARWPTVPLDMSASDPQIKAAYDAAVSKHALRALGLGVFVPALLYGLTRLLLQTRIESGPRRILLMRHAEKTGDPEDIHLSETGRVRAEHLAAYIPATFGTPDFIFAAARSKRSIRSMETVQPLAAALGLTVRHDIEDKDFAALIEKLQSEPAFNGSTVVLCWHHGKLPEIARMLGAAQGSYPDPWSEAVFDLILDFRYGSDGRLTVDRVAEPF